MVAMTHRQVANRRKRPAWATNDKQLMERCVSKSAMRRFKIAQMYWQQNMTAKDIATALDVTVNAVEVVLHRLTRS